MELVIKTSYLFIQGIQFSRFLIWIGGLHEVGLLLLLNLSCKLEDFLVLLIFALIALGQLALIVLNSSADSPAVVLRTLNLMM